VDNNEQFEAFPPIVSGSGAFVKHWASHTPATSDGEPTRRRNFTSEPRLTTPFTHFAKDAGQIKRERPAISFDLIKFVHNQIRTIIKDEILSDRLAQA
jgi:hypothetical protein